MNARIETKPNVMTNALPLFVTGAVFPYPMVLAHKTRSVRKDAEHKDVQNKDGSLLTS